jgi:hypothetical protein
MPVASADDMGMWSKIGVVVAGSTLVALDATTGCSHSVQSSGFGEGDDGGSGGSSGGGGTSSSGGFSSGGGFLTDGALNGTSGPDSGCPSGLTCNVTCGGTSTSISGTVYDPAMLNPLYNVTVFVPSGPLQPLPAGVPTGDDACSCAALYKSGYVTGTTTDVKGQFTLQNVPVGANVPLVLQVGKWRHVVTIPSITACQDNPQADKSLALNATVMPGSGDNMPDIAVSTGHSDTLECLLKRVGLPDSEFVAGTSTTGHVHLYDGGDPKSPYHGVTTNGHPTPELAPMAGAPESDTNLWDSQAHLMPYDILLLSCEGGPTYNANPPVLEQYLNAGGRAFASHYHYQWFDQTTPISPSTINAPTPADWSSLAMWTPGGASGPVSGPGWGTIVQTLNVGSGMFAKGQALAQWLANVGALGVDGVPPGDLPLYQSKFNAVVASTNAASQNWITEPGPSPNESEYFSFDTPVTATPGPDGGPPSYCGRAVFSDLHVTGDPTAPSAMDSPNLASSTTPPMPTGQPPPAGCAAGALSPQEKALEFMLFDLSSCVVPDTVPPSKTVY